MLYITYWEKLCIQNLKIFNLPQAIEAYNAKSAFQIENNQLKKSTTLKFFKQKYFLDYCLDYCKNLSRLTRFNKNAKKQTNSSHKISEKTSIPLIEQKSRTAFRDLLINPNFWEKIISFYPLDSLESKEISAFKDSWFEHGFYIDYHADGLSETFMTFNKIDSLIHEFSEEIEGYLQKPQESQFFPIEIVKAYQTYLLELQNYINAERKKVISALWIKLNFAVHSNNLTSDDVLFHTIQILLKDNLYAKPIKDLESKGIFKNIQLKQPEARYCMDTETFFSLHNSLLSYSSPLDKAKLFELPWLRAIPSSERSKIHTFSDAIAKRIGVDSTLLPQKPASPQFIFKGHHIQHQYAQAHFMKISAIDTAIFNLENAHNKETLREDMLLNYVNKIQETYFALKNEKEMRVNYFKKISGFFGKLLFPNAHIVLNKAKDLLNQQTEDFCLQQILLLEKLALSISILFDKGETLEESEQENHQAEIKMKIKILLQTVTGAVEDMLSLSHPYISRLKEVEKNIDNAIKNYQGEKINQKKRILHEKELLDLFAQNKKIGDPLNYHNSQFSQSIQRLKSYSEALDKNNPKDEIFLNEVNSLISNHKSAFLLFFELENQTLEAEIVQLLLMQHEFIIKMQDFITGEEYAEFEKSLLEVSKIYYSQYLTKILTSKDLSFDQETNESLTHQENMLLAIMPTTKEKDQIEQLRNLRVSQKNDELMIEAQRQENKLSHHLLTVYFEKDIQTLDRAIIDYIKRSEQMSVNGDEDILKAVLEIRDQMVEKNIEDVRQFAFKSEHYAQKVFLGVSEKKKESTFDKLLSTIKGSIDKEHDRSYLQQAINISASLHIEAKKSVLIFNLKDRQSHIDQIKNKIQTKTQQYRDQGMNQILAQHGKFAASQSAMQKEVNSPCVSQRRFNFAPIFN